MGKKTLLFRANTAFLGAKIPSGEHKIVLVYHAPGTDGWQLVQPDGRNAGTHPL